MSYDGRMRKLIVVAAIAAAGYGVARWQHDEPTDQGRGLAYNRMWIDHMPTGERDPFHVFAVFRPYAQGGFAVETRWHGEVERFRFEGEGDTIHAVFPWQGDREKIVLRAYRCDEADMDFCLEMTGSKRGTKKYYSRSGWERRSVDDVETFKRSLFE